MRDINKETAVLFDRCGIPHKMVNGGVFGRIGEFEFTFRNYYTVVDGLVPYNVAVELYDTVVGKKDIRVAGNCGCPHPKEWAKANHKGKEVIPASKYAAYQEEYKDSPLMKKIVDEMVEKYHVLTDDDLSPFTAYIDTYHIDSELGLYIFIQTLKKHNLI